MWLSVDPLVEQTFEPYIYAGNNPVLYTDPTGMNKEKPGEEGDPPASKLTGSKSLLVYINEPVVKTDLKKMHEKSGSYDFVTVDNIDQVQNVLETHYGKGKVPTIEHLVVRSHGATSETNSNNHGPDLDNKAGQGVVHNPENSKGLNYLKNILSNNAEIVFTACNAVMDYTKNSSALQESSISMAKNYSDFFLKGTNRSLFFNWAKSSSRIIGGSGEYFNFDSFLHQDKYGGFMQFKYNNSNMQYDSNFYNIKVRSDGGLERKFIKPINKSWSDPVPIINKRF
jgi:hypothetical protein